MKLYNFAATALAAGLLLLAVGCSKKEPAAEQQIANPVTEQQSLDEVNIAAGMMKGCSLTEFLDNEMLKRAVCMTVINVGELVKNLTEECRLSHPEVAWKEIAGFRDIAAHKYQTLRM